MWSPPHRALFIHVPKTGGQSVEHAFLGFFQHVPEQHRRPRLLLRPNLDPSRGPERLAHLTAVEYVRCGYLTQEEFDAAFKFSFVRNPWERLISEYLYRHLYKAMTFREYVLGGFPPPSDYDDHARHLIPQLDFLVDGDGRMLCDFVGHFETFQADFNIVMDRLGLRRRRLVHANRFKPEPGAERLPPQSDPRARRFTYYDDDTRERVAELYRRDIEAFGYTFEEDAPLRRLFPESGDSGDGVREVAARPA